MAMGKRKPRQESLFISTDQLTPSAGHPFYQKLNTLLDEAGFDRWVERRCAGSYECEEKRGQPSLLGKPYLLACFFFLAVAGERKSPIHGVPELRQRTLQILLLVGGSAHRGKLLLALECVDQIGLHALELRPPGGKRIVLARIRWTYIQHVTHGYTNRVEFVLNAQQLQRILAVPVNEIVLQLAEATHAAGHIK